MTLTESETRAAAEAAGQGHLFDDFDDLTEAEQRSLLADVAGLDFAAVDELRALLSGTEAAGGGELAPPELFPLERQGDQVQRARAAETLGRELLTDGRVGFVLVAGGQASRLGYDGPKGAFPVGPVSGRTLFEFHARRLLAASRRYGRPMPWYVMTSVANDGPTRAFMREHGYFGLPEEDVFFFVQDMLPALDDEGRILRAGRGRLFMAPNGHGGVLQALATSGALEDMERRGVDLISYFQVDNPLVRPADPLFLGLHRDEGASMSSKVVEKSDPGEKVGVLGTIAGRMGIIEYSDLSEELREAREDDGKLRFRAGNIAVHALERAFVEELTRDGLQLPWHRARKKMKVLGPEGELVESWGTKFEAFVFDALGRSERSVTMEVDRRSEFSPVKNAEGADSPATARRALCEMFAGWARAAGHPLPPADGEGVVPVEVDPLVAEEREEFVSADVAPTEHEGGHLYHRP